MKTFWTIYACAVFLLAYILLIRPVVGSVNWTRAHGYDLDEIIDSRESRVTKLAVHLRHLHGEMDMLQRNQLQAQFDLPDNYYWRVEQHREFLNGLRGK